AEREVGMSADRVSKCRLEDSFRGIRSQSLRAYVPEVPTDSRDEFPEAVQPRLAPVDHLFEDGLPELLMVRGEAMLHLDLDRRRADVPDAFEEQVEVRHVEIDHLAEGTGLVVEIDLEPQMGRPEAILEDRKSTRLNSSHQIISYAVFCLKKKK